MHIKAIGEGSKATGVRAGRKEEKSEAR